MADEAEYVPTEEDNFQAWVQALPERQPALAFQGDAEAILATNDNADQGIRDLVDAYKSNLWDNPEGALEILETYAQKLREKAPSPQNLLSPEETMELAPIKPKDTNYYIEEWEIRNKSRVENSKDPLIRAYQDLLTDSIENVATAAFQQANVEDDSIFSDITDKATRVTLGALPGLIKDFGLEKDFERNLRADSNDTLASAVSSGVGSILALPITVPNIVLNAEAYGREQYQESRAAGASRSRALGSAAIEGANQAADVILDKILLGTKEKAAASFVFSGLKRSIGEGTQEYVQNKLSEVADVVGLTREEFGALVSDQDALAFAAGSIVGGAVQIGQSLGPQQQAPSTPQPTEPEFISSATGQPVEQATTDLATQLQLSQTQPIPSVAVVGEPVAGGTNITTLEDASNGAIGVTNTEPVANTDAGELFVENTDGTTSRVVNGEKKQAHTGAIVVDSETANKIATIQASAPNGEPIVIRSDDLNRPYIQHPNVGPDLVVSPEATNTEPVMIPEEQSGHVLQYSAKENPLGSIEHSATISKAPINGVSTAGAQAVKESSIADKLRAGTLLNPNIRELLGLNEDFAVGLTYVPNTNDNTMRLVNDVFANFDNNYVAFANDLLQKDYADITTTEAIAAAFAGNSLSARADAIRAENPQAAEQYDVLAANLWSASQKVGSTAGQELQMRSIIPVTGNTIITAVKSEVSQLATAQVAQDAGLSVQEVENVVKENQQLENLNQGLNEREVVIQDLEKQAEERHDAPDKAVTELEKQISELDTSSSPDIAAAEEAVTVAEREFKEADKQATSLEKEADTIETEEEKITEKIAELTQQVKDLDTKIDTSKVDNLKEQKAALPKPTEAPKVKAAQEKVKLAKDVSEKARARLELQKALNEEKARGIKERAAIEEQIRKAEEEQAEEKKRQALEVKKAKEELARAKEEARAAKKQSAIDKRKQANELRAEKKRLRTEKEEALREARKQRAAELAETKKQKREQLAAAKAERTASRQLRKEQLALEKQRLTELRKSLQSDREKINERKQRNKNLTDAINKYKKDFTDKLTPQQTQKINDLVKLVQETTGETKRKALEELGKTIAQIKGVPLIPGSDPLSTFWQANVLFSIGTNTANIVGNFTTPIRQTISDLVRGKPGSAYKFIRGWAGAMFSRRTVSDIGAGFRGELGSRSTEDLSKQDLKDLGTGLTVIHETDPIRSLQSIFGTGKLGKFLSSPAITLRMLGAMDAVFSRAATQGRLAREAPSYKNYLDAKAADYNKYITQARNEEAQLNKLGIETSKSFVNRRADELSFLARPQEQQERITKAARKDVFQEEGGPRGLISRSVGQILSSTANAVRINRTKNLNTKWSVATALGFTNGTVRDNVSVDKIYPIVSRGLAQGKTLLINGKEIKGGTKEVIGSILEAVNKKQIISLRGDSIRPFKYVSGMFVSTSSQILDMSVETLPGIGLIDKRLGGRWREYTPEERSQLYGNQIAATVLTGSILYAFLPNMDDEDHAYSYVYGGMRDEKLRKYYEAKGIKPFSIRVGTRTISYKDIPGLNLIFGAIGELSDAHMVAKRTPERPLSVGATMQALVGGSFYAATQLSLLKNIGTLADLFALQDTQSATSAFDIISNISSGFVPFSGGARELERFIYGDLSRPKNMANRMLQNIPYAKFVSDNKPALNMFGEPLRPHVIPGINRFIGEAKNSFEIDWLLRNGYTVSLPKAGTTLTKKQLESYTEMQQSDDPENFEPYLTEEDQRKYIQAVGPELKNIIASYAMSDPQGWDEQVQKRLDKDVRKMKTRIKKTILSE